MSYGEIESLLETSSVVEADSDMWSGAALSKDVRAYLKCPPIKNRADFGKKGKEGDEAFSQYQQKRCQQYNINDEDNLRKEYEKELKDYDIEPREVDDKDVIC